MLASERIINEPHKVNIYLDNEGEQVPEGQAYFRRIEVSFRDSVSGSVRIYYHSGKLYSNTLYAHIRSGLRHGVETLWSESGKMIGRTEFVGGIAQEVFYY